jgi:serine O-acetyltransferase
MTRHPPMKLREFRSVLSADLACNYEDPYSRLTVFTFRLGQYATRGRPPFLRAAWRVLNILYVQLLIGAELPPVIECGPGLRLEHAGRGVIIHPDARIGSRAVILHRVTIGQRHGRVPVIGDNVSIGTGASVLGGLKVGDGARIGAGAVVIHDVPPGRTAVGVPATLVGADARRTA